jgi:hypothetical protein
MRRPAASGIGLFHCTKRYRGSIDSNRGMRIINVATVNALEECEDDIFRLSRTAGIREGVRCRDIRRLARHENE